MFAITREAHDVVRCRVWRDPHVDEAVGARSASEMSAALATHALHPSAPCPGLVFDVREGPPAFGPKTEASLRSLLSSAVNQRRPVAVVVAQAMQELQYTRLCGEVSSQLCLVTRDDSTALEFILQAHASAS